MAGTKIGGQRAAESNKQNYGNDFYSKIGKIGGANGTTGGFYGNPERARIAGKIGGAKSRRRKAKHVV